MSRWLQNLSRRELGLAVATAALLGAFLFGAGVKRGLATVRELDDRIDQLEQELIILHQHLAQRDEVDAAFQKISERHSTPLSKPEIHDYLRREIYRLAARRDLEGDPVSAASADAFLVNIPILREGVLNEFDDGYREYKISFRVPSARIEDVLLFVERLQQSEQLLRVDAFDLTRAPQAERVAAAFEVTRTVIDAPAGGIDMPLSDLLAHNGSVEEWSADGTAPQWIVDKGTARKNEKYATHGAAALEVEPTGPDARVYQEYVLRANQTYALTMDIAAESPGSVFVLDEDGGALGPKVDIPGDARPYRYEIEFTTPRQPGGRCNVIVPCIRIDRAEGPIVLDNVRIVANPPED